MENMWLSGAIFRWMDVYTHSISVIIDVRSTLAVPRPRGFETYDGDAESEVGRELNFIGAASTVPVAGLESSVFRSKRYIIVR
jgi:hypothetical protein